MRILFMGTPDFAAKSLEALCSTRHDICGVFTQADKPRSRGMKTSFSPVKELALAKGIEVFQPEKLRDGSAMDIVRKLNPELIAVVAYGKILPPDMLEYPEYGCVNIHGSLLPKYRGAAPIQHAVLNGESVTGVTAMFMSEKMDEGDIISVKKTPIGPRETSGELFDRLAELGAELLVETADALEAGEYTRTPQDGSLATYAPPLTKEMSPIDWDRTGKEIIDHIRGLDPWPCASADIAGTHFKIYKADAERADINARPGTVLKADKTGITVACADGTVTVTELQAAGGKRMDAGAYLLGHPIKP